MSGEIFRRPDQFGRQGAIVHKRLRSAGHALKACEDVLGALFVTVGTGPIRKSGSTFQWLRLSADFAQAQCADTGREQVL